MTLTNFPNGLTSFGIPLLGPGGSDLPVGGNYWFVDLATGANGNVGGFDSPLQTLAGAISRATANNNDVIVLMPGYTETIATAGGLTVDKAGLYIVGLGEGANRPTFTFSATASTFLITAANTVVRNIIGVPSIDSVVAPFSVAAANCELDIEWQDASASVEALRAVLTTAAADNFTCNLVYKGFTAGNAVVNAIRLVGCNNGRINVDYYGVLTTAVVEFLTTACTNIEVYGTFYVSGTTDFSKNVVDTVTGSTWGVQGWDAAAGMSFSGGSGSPVGGNDYAAVVANQAVPSPDSTANVLERDVVGNKADALITEVGTTDSVAAYVKGLVSQMWALPRSVEKLDGAVLLGDDPLFTITDGPVKILSITGIVTTGIGAGATSVKLELDTTTPAATVQMNAAAVDIDADAAGTSYRSINTTSVFTPVSAGFVLEANSFATNDTTFLAPIGTIMFNSDAARAGVIAWYLSYIPLSPASRVVAAA